MPPPLRVGLVQQSQQADWLSIQRVAAALDTQMRRDLLPLWGVEATVEPVQDAQNIPDGMLPILIQDHTPHSVGGLHTRNGGGTCFAVVLVSRDWGLGASHECIEMLVDPSGSRFVPGPGLRMNGTDVVDGPDQVQYLVEACDPMEDKDHAYAIDGVAVSDFYTPRYFDAAVQPGVRYSFNGSVTRPREVKRGGYLSWLEPRSNRMQQLCWFEDVPLIRTLPDHTAATADGAPHRISHREFIDRATITPRTHRARAEPVA